MPTYASINRRIRRAQALALALLARHYAAIERCKAESAALIALIPQIINAAHEQYAVLMNRFTDSGMTWSQAHREIIRLADIRDSALRYATTATQRGLETSDYLLSLQSNGKLPDGDANAWLQLIHALEEQARAEAALAPPPVVSPDLATAISDQPSDDSATGSSTHPPIHPVHPVHPVHPDPTLETLYPTPETLPPAPRRLVRPKEWPPALIHPGIPEGDDPWSIFTVQPDNRRT